MQKNLLSVNLVIWGEARSRYTQTNARGSLAFMAPELIIEELSIPSAGIDELKTVDAWADLMPFFTILNPGQSYSFKMI